MHCSQKYLQKHPYTQKNYNTRKQSFSTPNDKKKSRKKSLRSLCRTFLSGRVLFIKKCEKAAASPASQDFTGHFCSVHLHSLQSEKPRKQTLNSTQDQTAVVFLTKKLRSSDRMWEKWMNVREFFCTETIWWKNSGVTNPSYSDWLQTLLELRWLQEPSWVKPSKLAVVHRFGH